MKIYTIVGLPMQKKVGNLYIPAPTRWVMAAVTHKYKGTKMTFTEDKESALKMSSSRAEELRILLATRAEKTGKDVIIEKIEFSPVEGKAADRSTIALIQAFSY